MVRKEQWNWFKRAANGEDAGDPRLSLIIDSPWIPGHVGVSHLEYYNDPEKWFQSNLAVLRQFPDVVFLPGWWVEYGMAIEPTALGARAAFHSDQPPGVIPLLTSLDDVDRLPDVNPATDTLMAFTLDRYRRWKERIFGEGFTIPMVAARGPICTAAFVRGLNDFLMDLLDNPAQVHRLLDVTTRLTIDWLTAQADAVGESVEGLLLLDDIPGLMSREHYQEFSHPYLTRVFEAFPKNWVKVYHNDANLRRVLDLLPDTGCQVLNWGKMIDITEAASASAGRLVLLGNLDPLDLGTRGTPERVEAGTRDLAAKWKSTGRSGGWIPSVGGGVSPGMPAANINAMLSALRR